MFRESQKLKSSEVSRTWLAKLEDWTADRTTWIILVRLSMWKSTNDKSVRSERMGDGTLDTPRTIAIEPCSHGGSLCRSVMHDRSAENLCLRRARKNDPFIRYQNMEILLRWCLGLLRETSTHLESVILPWVKPAYPLVVSSPSRILHLPSSRSLPRRPRARICVYLVIFALSTANKFTFANGKCHFIVRRRNNLSKFSPKDINKKAGWLAHLCPPDLRGVAEYDTKLIFSKARGVLNRRWLRSSVTEKYRRCVLGGM